MPVQGKEERKIEEKVQSSQKKQVNQSTKSLEKLLKTLRATAKSVGQVALSISQTGKAAASAAKSTKKLKGEIRDLFSFDEINRLSSVSTSSSRSGSSRRKSSSSGRKSGDEETLTWLDRLKKLLGELAEPLKKFWNMNSKNAVAAFQNLYSAASGLAEVIRNALSWGFEHVLVPLAKWTLNTAAPDVMNLLAAAIKVVTQALLILKPAAQFLWENLLQPLAQLVGSKIASTLELITAALEWLAGGLETVAEIVNSSHPLEGFAKLGSDMVQGVAAGIRGAWNTVTQGAAEVVSGFLTAIGNALGNGWESVRTKVLGLLKKLIGDGTSQAAANPLSLAVKLGNTAAQLWSGLKNGWNALSAKVSVVNSLFNTAATLWSSFQSGWGTRSVSIVDTLKSSAGTLWSGFKTKWGSRSVTITNTLKNSAATLWSKFKAGWTGKSLGLRVTYTGVSGVRAAICKALGLSGWPKLSFAAKGGIVDAATLLGNTIVGEAGREAIVPLERNTQWANIVADQMADRLTRRMGANGPGSNQPVVVQVKLDGRVVGETTVDYLRAQAAQGWYPLSNML